MLAVQVDKVFDDKIELVVRDMDNIVLFIDVEKKLIITDTGTDEREVRLHVEVRESAQNPRKFVVDTYRKARLQSERSDDHHE